MKKHIEVDNIILVVNQYKRDSASIAEEMISFFRKKDIPCRCYKVNQEIPDQVLEKKNSLAISVGGDGTFLYAARRLVDFEIPIIGINLGTFGFITEISKYEWRKSFENLQSGNCSLSRRLMLDVCVCRGDKEMILQKGLNDVVISSSGVARLIKLKVSFSDLFVSRYRADGLIIATPTGSTAYSMSAGGPIIHPGMEALIINPICPFTLSHRPLVIPSDEIIQVEVEQEDDRLEYILNVDGNNVMKLEPRDRITIQAARNRCVIINSEKRNFYEVLRAKLNWSGEPNA